MIEVHMLRTGFTPVEQPSDNLRKRVAYALKGVESAPEACFANPFSLEGYQVTDIDGKDYDVREVLQYITAGQGFEEADPMLLPCPKQQDCVNPVHAKTLVLSPVSKYRFFMERNPLIMDHLKIDLHDQKKCWINVRVVTEEHRLLRQMVAIAFGVFATDQVKHLLAFDAYYGFVKNRGDGQVTWVACHKGCVNPYHAPVSLVPVAQAQDEIPVEESANDVEAFFKFKDYIFSELGVSRGALVCKSKKLSYSSEEIAEKARVKWVALGLDTYGGARVYKCHRCSFWHLSSQRLRNPKKARGKKTRSTAT